MSTTQQPTASHSTAAPPRSSLRRFLFPVIVVIVCGGVFAAPHVWAALDRDTDAAMPVFMMMMFFSLPLAVFLLTIWWLFFSGFRWTTKLGLVALVGVAVTGFVFSLRKVELTSIRTGLVPIFYFKWEKSTDDRYDEFREQQINVLPAPDASVGAEDFPSYRGPNRDGIVPHAKLETDWNKHRPKGIWSHPCVEGYSGIAVAGNLAVTLEQRQDKEVIVCYDRATGAERWTYAYDTYYKNEMGDGPRSTPTIHNQQIYTLGATGELVCVNAKGEEQWQVNILKDSQAKNIKWGLSGSPLIVNDLVVAHAGIDPDHPAGAALVAFDQATGKKRWAIGNRRAGYSSPQLVTLGNVRQILLFDGEGLVSYDPKTQKELWSAPWETDWDMNSIQPVVIGDDRVFISSELKNGCAMLRVVPPTNDGSHWTVEVVWKNKDLAARFANPVTDGKRIFGLHGLGGQLRCLNVDDGRLLWRGDRYGPGQMLLAGDQLLIVSEKGVITLMDKDASQETELARHALLDPSRKTWNTPALAGDQLFVRNQAEIACLKLPLRR